MSESGRLQVDPLFQGLARPTMIMGVSYMYFVLNAGINMISFINTSSFLVLFVVFPVVHAIGFLICMKEPRAVELMVLKASHGLKCVNRKFHGNTNSYDMF